MYRYLIEKRISPSVRFQMHDNSVKKPLHAACRAGKKGYFKPVFRRNLVFFVFISWVAFMYKTVLLRRMEEYMPPFPAKREKHRKGLSLFLDGERENPV